jgi:hypothetical protein
VIGEWFVVSQLTANPTLTQNLHADLTDDQAARALGLLARAADWLAEAGPLFGEFAGGDVRRQILAATQATLTGDAGRSLLDIVVAGYLRSTGDWPLSQLEDLRKQIPEYLLPRTQAAIGILIVAVYRALAVDDPDAYASGLAWALDNLGARLDALGGTARHSTPPPKPSPSAAHSPPPTPTPTTRTSPAH